MEELKKEYDSKIKLIEERINNRENRLAEHKINEVERKYQEDVINKQYEIDQLKKDNEYYISQNKILQNENITLKDNKEFNSKLNELKKENYISHEKINLLEQEKQMLEKENTMLKNALRQPNKKDNNSNNNDDGSINFNNNSLDKEFNKKVNDNRPDAMKIYEQLLNEREITTQENLLNNYLKEIEKLNKEIYFLKTLPTGGANGGRVLKNNFIDGNKDIINNNNSDTDINLNNIQGGNNTQFNNTLTNPSLDNYKLKSNKKNKNNLNYQINPSLQESAEKQIKKLQSYLLPSPSDPGNNKMVLMEKEFSRLQTEDTPNEITFENYINVMNNLQIPLTSNELIEIFNNFPRIKGNSIRMNDFINSLNSKTPSAFFMQSDPSYLNELESKLIKSQNRIKELEKFILVNNNENEEYKDQIKKSMNENKVLKNKINDLNSQILQYFLFREEKNMSNPDVIQMKEKMKNFELKNKNMNSDLVDKFEKYDKKIDEMKKKYEDDKSAFAKEKEGYKEQINSLKMEKEKNKNDFDKKEIKYKTEIAQLNEKLNKYKKNYNAILDKNESLKQEKEKILTCLRDKGFDPDQIMTFVNSTYELQTILRKVEDLEKKNMNREEIYKKICMNINSSQVNKELEKLAKRHEEEKRGLLKIIAQKNNELNSIKTEFFDIMTELEKLKALKSK